MGYTPIVPAELAFDDNGIPFAPAYGDSYHSASGALEQARHVFIAGNRLPERWSGRSFTILETGFGIGLSFLCTWNLWNSQPEPGKRLHYVALEKHPFRRDDLKALHARWPELAPLAERLQAQWPLPLPGLHRLEFGDVVLTLGFGDAVDLLPRMTLAADAIYLDGFAPPRNPEMWSDALFAALAQRAAPGATLASWSVLDDMMFRLSRAGFRLEKRPGFGTKRYMLAGHLPGAVSPGLTFRSRRITVIGAGIAGASVAHALARRGHKVMVVEAGPTPAQGASGNHAGVFRPLPSLDDSRLARLLRAGFFLGRRQFPALADVSNVRLGWTGALHIARDPQHEETQRRIVSEHRQPAEFCRFVERDEASALAGWPVELGGWWFPQAGWINPPSLVRALLAARAEIDCRFGFRALRLERQDDRWRVIGEVDAIEADDVVIANGIDAPQLAPEFKLPIRIGRGQVSHLPEAATPPFNIVATRLGYVTPAIDGIRCAGATMASGDRDSASRLDDHVENLYRLDMLLPGFGTGLDPATLDGRVSFRPMSPDRLPLVGPLAASEGLWIIDGFGARGLVFAPICAELLASQIDNEPLPLEDDLVTALSPARFGRKPRV